MKTWNEALIAMRNGKRVKRINWEDGDWIYKYEDVIMYSNNRGLVEWKNTRNYPNCNDWVIL